MATFNTDGPKQLAAMTEWLERRAAKEKADE